jgi:hypothetical protein
LAEDKTLEGALEENAIYSYQKSKEEWKGG